MGSLDHLAGRPPEMIKLTITQSKSDKYYYAQMSIREGKKVRSETIKKIGKHSELLKITDDPEAYALAEVKRLDEEYQKARAPLNYNVDFSKKIEETDSAVSGSTILNTGYFFLQYILSELELRKYFSSLAAGSKIQYDSYKIFRFLTYDRILFSGSKLKTWNHLGNYYEKPEFGYHDILRFMDILANDFDGFISYLFEKSSNLVTRDLSVCYYDCTNFYFEIEKEDQEYIDEVTGEVIRGLREYGFSKEHRPNPIVQMGLFMDSDGIPLSMCIHSGSTNEQLTAIPAEKKIVEMFKDKKFIYCADAGLGSVKIRKYNSFKDRAFIITQSIKKLSAQMQEAVFDNTDYKLLSKDQAVTIDYMKSFDRKAEENRYLYHDKAYKVIPADLSIELNGFYDEKQYKNGNTKQVKSKVKIPQSLIITFSRKQFEFQRAIRNRQIERARELLSNAKDPEEIKKGPNDVRRFIRRKKTRAEENMTIQDLYEINNERILEEEKYDGFYAIATNLEVLDSNLCAKKPEVLKVLSIMANRNKVEDDFRIMKTNFDARPVYHRLPNRITAHFMICYAALLVHRLLEKLMDDNGPAHFTINDLIETLRNINVAPTDAKFYTALYTGGRILSTLQNISGIYLDMKHYRPKDLDITIKKLVRK